MAVQTSSSLHKQLIVGCAIMLGFSLMLSISLILIFHNSYSRADRNLHLLSLYKQVLVAANRISAERGPMNSVLGEEPSADSPSRRKLAEFRTVADASLNAIAASEAGAAEDMHHPLPAGSVDEIRDRLELARRAADRLAALPRAERTTEKISAVITGMFDVVDVMRPAISQTVVNLVAEDQTLAGPALMGQILGELREYAGRLGSHVMPSIAVHRPLAIDAQNEVNRTRGRIFALWQLAEKQAGLYRDEPRLAAAQRDVSAMYFGIGLPLIDRTVATGQVSGDYGTTTTQLTDRYVPTMEPLERLRVTFLEVTVERSAAARADALRWLVYVSLITGLIVLANIALIVSARRFVFLPLLAARDQVIALSEGRDLDEVSSPTDANEMRHLFDALEGLRLKMRERLQYTERLKIQAETDSLTGLLNRHSLDRFGQGDAAFRDIPEDIAIVLMDIDHFKSINDTHGHVAGDLVLQRVARLVLGMIGETDLAVRYGGEEIAIVVTGSGRMTAPDLAERIRAELEKTGVPLDDGRHIKVSASFGVAMGRRGVPHWLYTVHDADRALYRAKSGGRNRVCLGQAALESAVEQVA